MFDLSIKLPIFVNNKKLLSNSINFLSILLFYMNSIINYETNIILS